MRIFGLTKSKLKSCLVEHRCSLDIEPGEIVYITGPSGSGKSVMLKELARSLGDEKAVNLDDIPLDSEGRVIDCIEGRCLESMRILSAAGLNDVTSLLSRPVNLSDGQKYRFRLAGALASGKKYILADEFCANLDRITAAVISYNIRKFASRNKIAFILAAAHEDILADLYPDIIVSRELSGEVKIIRREMR